MTSSIDQTVRIWNNLTLESWDNLREELTQQLSTATSACLGPEEWELHLGGDFPDSTRKRYEACDPKSAAQQEPTVAVSTKGGE